MRSHEQKVLGSAALTPTPLPEVEGLDPARGLLSRVG